MSGPVRDDTALRAPARLFSALLLRELDEPALAALQQPAVADALADLQVRLPAPGELPRLAGEFFDDVLQPREAAPLVQSLWTEGRYDGDAAVAVRRYAAAAGLELGVAARNAPVDHLGCLLALWAELHERDAEVAARFAQQHLTWVARSAAPRAVGDGFYRQVQRAAAALSAEIVAGGRS